MAAFNAGSSSTTTPQMMNIVCQAVIFMPQYISDRAHLSPWDVRLEGFDFIRQGPAGLGNNFGAALHSVLENPVALIVGHVLPATAA